MHRRPLAASFVLICAVTVGVSQSSLAVGPTMEDGGGGEQLSACVEQAQQTVDGAWTCTGGSLNYEVADEDGSHWTRAHTVGRGSRQSRLGARRDGSAVMSPNNIGDDYDWWCEDRGTCTRVLPNNHIAEIKGNVAYGFDQEVSGNFDIVWRQSFQGPGTPTAHACSGTEDPTLKPTG